MAYLYWHNMSIWKGVLNLETHKSDWRIYTKTTRLQDIATGCSGKKKQLHAKFFNEGSKGNSTNTLGTTITSYKVPCGGYMSLNTITSEAIHVENMQRACTSTSTRDMYTSIVFPQNFSDEVHCPPLRFIHLYKATFPVNLSPLVNLY